MGKLQLILFLVVLPLVFVLSYSVPFDYLELPLEAPPTKFDYFKFALQWPPSVWSRTGTPPADFTIHGLWPDDYNRDDLEWCDPSRRYVPITDSFLRQNLDKYWPNLQPGTNEEFWKYQWDKHGTCAFGYTQTEYFTFAVHLKQIYKDLLQYLQNNSIIPGYYYQTQTIINSVMAYTGRVPDLMCKTKGSTFTLTLDEIRICFNKTAHLIDCPANRLSSSCGRGTILFPLWYSFHYGDLP